MRVFLLVEQNAAMALDLAHRGYALEVGRIALADDARARRERRSPQGQARRRVTARTQARSLRRFRRQLVPERGTGTVAAPETAFVDGLVFQRLKASNFGCFRSLSVDLARLTVAIGENNSGKSTFLEALRRAATEPPSAPIPQHLRFHGEDRDASLLLSPSRRLLSAQVLKLLLPSSGPVITSEGFDDTGGPAMLTEDGQNVAAFVDWMLRRDRARFDGFVNAVRSLVPGVRDVEVGTPSANRRSLHLHVEGGWRHSADEVSTGVRLLLCFLALAWHPAPPELVMIEEPENGVHPRRLKEVMDLIRILSRGTHAPAPVQVVVTTHSPYLLSFLDPPDDHLLVFRRGADGACTAESLDMDRIAPFTKDFSLGEIWSNLGEAKLVRG